MQKNHKYKIAISMEIIWRGYIDGFHIPLLKVGGDLPDNLDHELFAAYIIHAACDTFNAIPIEKDETHPDGS